MLYLELCVLIFNAYIFMGLLLFVRRLWEGELHRMFNSIDVIQEESCEEESAAA